MTHVDTEFTEQRRAGVERHWQSIAQGLLDATAPDTWQVNMTKSGFEWALSGKCRAVPPRQQC